MAVMTLRAVACAGELVRRYRSGPPLRQETRAGPACPRPRRGASGGPYPARKRTPGIRGELAFDSRKKKKKKKKRNHKNPLTGSVHASRGLPRASPELPA
jgi:hypothetical protein